MQSQFPRGSRSSVIPLLLCIYIRIWFKPPPLRTYTELKINNYKTENQQLQKQIFRLARGRRNSTTTISLQTYNICADNIIYADSSIVYQYHNFIATPVNCEHRQLSRKSPPSHPLSQNVHPTHGDKKKKSVHRRTDIWPNRHGEDTRPKYVRKLLVCKHKRVFRGVQRKLS